MSLLLLATLGVGCDPLRSNHSPPAGGDGDDPEQDALVVSPAEIDFGEVSVNGEGWVRRSFTVTNAGTSSVMVHGHDEVALLDAPEGVEEAVFEVAAEPIFELAAGSSQEFQVTFRPVTDGRWGGEIRVNYGIELLSLVGEGTAPVVELGAADVPSTPIGCASAVSVLVANLGQEALVASDLWISGDAAFTLDGEEPGWTLDPGGADAISVVFAPPWDTEGGGERTAVLAVSTNDPYTPIAEARLRGLAYEGEKVTESFTYRPGIDTDLVFVVDTDGVMAAHLVKAQEAMEALIDALDDGNVNLHATVLTGGDSCPTTIPTYVTTGDRRTQRIDTLSEGMAGPPGDWSDRLLELAVAGLANDAAGACLEGFSRADAQLHVVAISGGPDGSGKTAAEQVAALAAAAPEARLVVASAIIATDGVGCGGATYGAGYADAAVASGGEIQNLCASDWEPVFESIAAVSTAAAAGSMVHELETLPVAESIRVYVDGADFAHWSYDPVENAITFSAETAPEAGASIDVVYTAAVACE